MTGGHGGIWADIDIATVITVAMLIIAVVGIRLPPAPRPPWSPSSTILAGFVITGLVLVLPRRMPGITATRQKWQPVGPTAGLGYETVASLGARDRQKARIL